MENNSGVEVLDIYTCEIPLSNDNKLLLHDMLYAPEVRLSLVSVLVLVRLGYYVLFAQKGETLYC